MSAEVRLLVYFIVSAAVSLIAAPFAVRALRRLKAGQTVLGYVTQHEHKTGTPTMGGVIFLLPLVVVCAAEGTAFALVALALTLGYAALGFLDDLIKIRFRRNLGLKAYQKIVGQLGLAAIAAYFCFAHPAVGTKISLPFGAGEGDLGWGIIPFVMLVYVATTNSVNLTDGLDGLAATTSAGGGGAFFPRGVFRLPLRGTARLSCLQLQPCRGDDGGYGLIGSRRRRRERRRVLACGIAPAPCRHNVRVVEHICDIAGDLLPPHGTARIPDGSLPSPSRNERLLGTEDKRALSRGHSCGGSPHSDLCEGNMNLTGKTVVVYGAGVSGISAAQLVRDMGGRAVIYDDNPKKSHSTSNTAVFRDCDIVVTSPGVRSDNELLLEARLAGKQVIGELEFASLFCAAEQIAVTGTNGKTTAVMLIDRILKCAHVPSHVVGNIGTAFSAVADKLDAMETAVIEASSFQLEGMRFFAPDIAVMLNITPDHLDRHGSMERLSLEPVMRARKVPFSLTRPVDGAYLSSGFVCFRGKPVVSVEDIDMSGRELEDVLAAVAVAAVKGVSFYAMSSALASFRRPEYRREECGSVRGVKVFNDSKATNVFSTVSAAESMAGDTVLILGGADRGEDFDELFASLPRTVKGAVVTGENAEKIASAAREHGFAPLSESPTIADACADAVELARMLDCGNVLFSPASKSYDRYSSFVERGRAFDAAVRRLSDGEKG